MIRKTHTLKTPEILTKQKNTDMDIASIVLDFMMCTVATITAIVDRIENIKATILIEEFDNIRSEYERKSCDVFLMFSKRLLLTEERIVFCSIPNTFINNFIVAKPNIFSPNKNAATILVLLIIFRAVVLFFLIIEKTNDTIKSGKFKTNSSLRLCIPRQ